MGGGAVHETMLEAVDAAITAALASGFIDAEAQAVQIAVMRKTAALMDEPGWPVVDADGSGKGRFDNVSPSTLLKCCDALGLNPLKVEVRERRGQLAEMRAGLSAIKGGRAS